MADPWSDALGDLELTGVFYATARMTEPWGIDLPALPWTAMFHLLTAGRAVVSVDGDVHELVPGELLLVPHGTGHQILSAPDAPASGLWGIEREVVGERYERLVVDGGGAPARLVCGAVTFADPGVGRLLASLPAVVRAHGGETGSWLRAAVDAIAHEAEHPRGGSDVVTARLADVILVQAVRDWLDDAEPPSGWLAALRDDVLGPVLAAVHTDPARPWTLESLAALAHLSRSAFAERFAAVVGEPPAAYVAGWRLGLAARMLCEPGASVAAVAERVGYDSVPGFHRAFTRRHGMTPGAWRRTGGARTLADVIDPPPEVRERIAR
ncbi:transcriptional regulator, AraC family [Xylanimonas cellulosilytica DSM 15894]|uniref:Transcriptional regulator, AraC family n=1 Tax=Xylanimonas cellulosilytica (strain DSM 15894 / JCM 12276 / CECT 5975 / KCTC 9989 / LMG 20990 / NBRC 107835 / XIL07) TaxID=446471 RepID=D1BRX4_XYLCX|nr:cupin domain-containing protein [Xylanimonas cellulosilytica]ACZ30466.1 transcriptional regulator, AraC family [Xylanimonas cellulosilytica DSM 15894]